MREIQPPFFPMYSITFTKNLFIAQTKTGALIPENEYKMLELSSFPRNNYTIRANTFVMSINPFPQEPSTKSTPKSGKQTGEKQPGYDPRFGQTAKTTFK